MPKLPRKRGNSSSPTITLWPHPERKLSQCCPTTNHDPMLTDAHYLTERGLSSCLHKLPGCPADFSPHHVNLAQKNCPAPIRILQELRPEQLHPWNSSPHSVMFGVWVFSTLFLYKGSPTCTHTPVISESSKCQTDRKTNYFPLALSSCVEMLSCFFISAEKRKTSQQPRKTSLFYWLLCTYNIIIEEHRCCKIYGSGAG